MLKMALTEKGIPMDGHYAIDFDRHLQTSNPVSSTDISSHTHPELRNGSFNSNTAPSPRQLETEAHPLPSTAQEDFHADEDGGIDL